MNIGSSWKERRGREAVLGQGLLLFAACILLSWLVFQPWTASGQAPQLEVELITWRALGLDTIEPDSNDGPNTYVVAVRICNSNPDGVQANNIQANFSWEDGDASSAIQLVSSDPPNPDTLNRNLGSLGTGACLILPYNISVARSAGSFDETRNYRIVVTADGISGDNAPDVTQELFVTRFEARGPQGNGQAPQVTGPETVEVGQTVSYTIESGPIPADYHQLVHQAYFPPNIFHIIGIQANYATFPADMARDQFYADACGWKYTDPSDFTCTDTNQLVGGSVSVTFTVRVVGTGTTTLSNLVYGYSESDDTEGEGTFYYQDFSSYPDESSLTVNAVPGVETDTPTPTVTGTPPTPTTTGTGTPATPTPTITGTPPTSTMTLTPTVTGTPPTLTPTLTPTRTGTVVPSISVDYSVSPSEARPAQNVTFTLDVENDGSADATSVRVTDTYSNFLDIRSVSISPSSAGTYSISGRTFTATLNTLEDGEEVRVTIVTTVNNSATTTTTETTSAVLTYTYNGTRTVTSNSVSVRILGGTTLPGTGGMEIQQSQGPPSILGAVVLVAALLTLLGAGVLALSFWARTHQPAWADWYLRTGFILITAAVLFGLGAWGLNQDSQNGGELAALIAGTPRASEELPDPQFLPTDDAASLPIYWPTSTPEPETLPDYPIPTPSVQPTPGGDGQPQVDTSPVNRISIPVLGVDTIVKYVPFDGYTWMIAGLQQEVAWMGDTSWPGLGGNTALAGHVSLRTGADGPFRSLEQIQPGQEVVVYTDQNVYTYRVSSIQEVEVSDVSLIQQRETPELTLITCTDWDQEERLYQKRLVVNSELVEVKPFFNETANRLP